MSGMTSERLEELRRIAEAATPGPWWVDGWEARTKDGDRFIASIAPAFQGASPDASCWEVDANIQHIAAFDPTTCLALLDRIEALEQERDAALGEVEKLRSVIRDLLPIAEARVAWEEEYESDALSSTSWIEPKTRVIARAKEVLGDDTGGATHA